MTQAQKKKKEEKPSQRMWVIITWRLSMQTAANWLKGWEFIVRWLSVNFQRKTFKLFWRMPISLLWTALKKVLQMIHVFQPLYITSQSVSPLYFHYFSEICFHDSLTKLTFEGNSFLLHTHTFLLLNVSYKTDHKYHTFYIIFQIQILSVTWLLYGIKMTKTFIRMSHFVWNRRKKIIQV